MAIGYMAWYVFYTKFHPEPYIFRCFIQSCTLYNHVQHLLVVGINNGSNNDNTGNSLCTCNSNSCIYNSPKRFR